MTYVIGGMPLVVNEGRLSCVSFYFIFLCFFGHDVSFDT